MQRKTDHKEKMPYGVDFIHFAYLVMGVLGIMFLLFSLQWIKYISWQLWLYHAFSTGCMWIIINGISKRKRWLTTLILIFATLSFISSFFHIIADEPLSGFVIAKKVIQFFYALFFGFNIIIFSRKKTRRYFDQKGVVLVS